VISFPVKALGAGVVAAALAAALLALPLPAQDRRTDTPDAAVPVPRGILQTANSAEGAVVLVRQLRSHLEKQPRDARSWAILARLEFDRDHFAEAAQAYDKALGLPSKVANDPAVWCEYADALGMAQNGRLAGRPRELIDRALTLNPKHPKALEMAGSADYAQGDYRAALFYWRKLLSILEPGSQAHTELTAAVARTERFELLTVTAQRQ